MRTNLKVFRVKQHLSQAEISDKIGVSRNTYAAIESGIREGRDPFWKGLQEAFRIPDSEMWSLKRND